MNAVCDHDVTDVERNVMVTCTCVDDWLFWHGLPVLATMCDSRGVWMTDTLDCLGKTVFHVQRMLVYTPVLQWYRCVWCCADTG